MLRFSTCPGECEEKQVQRSSRAGQALLIWRYLPSDGRLHSVGVCYQVGPFISYQADFIQKEGMSSVIVDHIQQF